MPFPRMHCSDPEKLGRLIKHWSQNPGSEPRTIEDLLEQAAKAGFEVTFHDYPNGRPSGLKITRQPATDVLYIQVPHPDGIDQAIADVTHNGSYPLPEFYNGAFADAKRLEMSKQEMESFTFKRIAEYSTNKCQ